jgi:hypothetical protein
MSEVLERGSIYFFYRPRIGEEAPAREADLQRFYVVLSSDRDGLVRLITVGRKHLPDAPGKERTWGFVSRVGRRPEEVEDELDPARYQTKTRGEREQPAARPAGEGIYAIVDHDGHTHLAYALELPRSTGEVQRELNIEEQGSYIVSVRNPEAPAPPQAGLRCEQRPEYPRALRERFRGRRFGELDPPDYLDYEGAELLLIGAADDPVAELGIRLDPERESAASADVFHDLRLERDKHPLEPLFHGDWE